MKWYSTLGAVLLLKVLRSDLRWRSRFTFRTAMNSLLLCDYCSSTVRNYLQPSSQYRREPDDLSQKARAPRFRTQALLWCSREISTVSPHLRQTPAPDAIMRRLLAGEVIGSRKSSCWLNGSII